MSDIKLVLGKIATAIETRGAEIEQLERDVSKIPDIISALAILNKSMTRVAEAVERVELCVGFVRADLEKLNKHGCKFGNGGPDDGEPTNPDTLQQAHLALVGQ